MGQSLLDLKMKIKKYSDCQLAETAYNWNADELAGADLDDAGRKYVNALREEIIERFINRELQVTAKAEKVIKDLKELGELVKVAGIAPETAGFIYNDLPFSEIDYDKIEKALGFKLFIWQKTYIERGEYRQSGKTTAVALRTLLTDIEKPLELQRPHSAREKIEQQQLIDIYKKLQAANVPCRKITKIHK